ncbi:cation:proton antiporter [Marivirga sp. S37H4]|uniref:Cation:proton antiporter n=1 Tax=Marivirga aurantiaca TaxID=2802615 RepID=A0A934WXZ1_9BACT|nr:monovalent cation/H+ antiporter complex subunit F [Marivirga aurantiaca]MBK6264966.1 cation:proton antiporter [Marivirga aurantiaca]
MNYFETLLWVALLALIVAFFITMIRFVYGPTFMDRVVTFDLMTANLVGVIGIYAMISDDAMLLDVALVLALIGFFGIMAFAYYTRKRTKNDR